MATETSYTRLQKERNQALDLLAERDAVIEDLVARLADAGALPGSTVKSAIGAVLARPQASLRKARIG